MVEHPSREDAEGRIASLVAASDAAEVAATAAAQAPAEPDEPSPSSFDDEDFLFHLYRGSELLQDNCFGEAKEELERALALQPRDTEGQGLLGVVYFRLGLYPRAIRIYEQIIQACPDEVTPRVNLALCYLKTGQGAPAKEQLEEVIRRVPDHVRAWGYLGLVYERMGDLEKALAAFERAGQTHMVRRLRAASAAQRAPEGEGPSERAALAAAAADAVQELEGEADPRPFRAAEPATAHGSGRWRAIELGETRLPATTGAVSGRAPQTADALVAESALDGSRGPAVRIEADGTALVTVTGSFAVRLDTLAALAPEQRPFKSSQLRRRARGRELDEPLGGVAAPIVLLEGDGLVVVRQRALSEEGRRLVAIAMTGEFLYAREQALVGFDGTLRHESGRLSLGGGHDVAMIQLSGQGTVLLEPRSALRSLAVRAERRAWVRGEDVLGWTGRLLPQPAGPEDAPAAGFVGFSGDGALLLDPD
jgi:hypothetical protein